MCIANNTQFEFLLSVFIKSGFLQIMPLGALGRYIEFYLRKNAFKLPFFTTHVCSSLLVIRSRKHVSGDLINQDPVTIRFYLCCSVSSKTWLILYVMFHHLQQVYRPGHDIISFFGLPPLHIFRFP